MQCSRNHSVIFAQEPRPVCRFDVLVNGGRYFLRHNEPSHVRQRIEVLDYGLVWFDRDVKLVFQKRHNLEDRDRIKYSSRHQWGRVGQGRGVFAGQVFVKDKGFYRCFDVFWVHKGFSIRSAASRFQLVTAFADAIPVACSVNQTAVGPGARTIRSRAAGDQVL